MSSGSAKRSAVVLRRAIAAAIALSLAACSVPAGRRDGNSGGSSSGGSGSTSGSGTTSGAGSSSGGSTSSGAGTSSGGGTTSGAASSSGGETSSGAGTSSGGGTTSGGASSGSGSSSGGSGGSVTVSINAGGPVTAAFRADAFFSGGDTYSTTNDIDTSLLGADAPPASIFQTERFGDFTYTVPNRTPGTRQTVTLYFQESLWTEAGQRTFDVAVNGSTVLSAFDIFAEAGGQNRAIAKTFATVADASGKVTIQFTGTGPDHPKVCAVGVAGEGTEPPPDEGSSSGGSTSGGSTSGGSTSGGSTSGGSTSGGSTSGGTSSGGADPVRSAGCGSTTAPRSGTYTINAAGLDRTYILDVPADYDPNKPYKLVFAWHPLGGNARGIADGDGGYYGLKPRSNGAAIFVAGDGIDNGWPNYGGRDIAFTRAMVDRLTSELCIDRSRIFSMGWSFGGMFSFAIGCDLADIFRAIAPASGALISCDPGTHPIAMWGAHGIYDNFVTLDSGRAARDVILARNHCSTTTSEPDANHCVTYQGCDAGYPVVWCEWTGPHGYPEFARDETWKFFSQF